MTETIFGIDSNTLEIFASIAISSIVTYLTKHGVDLNKLTSAKQQVEQKEHQFRLFVDAVDNAVYNEKIDETTFRAIYETGKTLINIPKNNIQPSAK